jgi:hypothetical protein
MTWWLMIGAMVDARDLGRDQSAKLIAEHKLHRVSTTVPIGAKEKLERVEARPIHGAVPTLGRLRLREGAACVTRPGTNAKPATNR